jgi:hypothetical protein
MHGLEELCQVLQVVVPLSIRRVPSLYLFAYTECSAIFTRCMHLHCGCSMLSSAFNAKGPGICMARP